MAAQPSFFARVLDAVRSKDPTALDALLNAAPSQDHLVDALRDPQAIAEHGVPPLVQAVWSHNTAGVQRLLEISPRLALDASADGHTPLMIALCQSDPSLVDRRLPVSDQAAEDALFHETMVDQMVVNARPAIVERCLPYLIGAPRNRDGRTPLMVAAEHGSTSTVGLLCCQAASRTPGTRKDAPR